MKRRLSGKAKSTPSSESVIIQTIVTCSGISRPVMIM